MAEIFLCPKDQLDARARRDLRVVGVVVVEVEDPSKCQLIRASETLSGDDMLWAALDALCHTGGYGDVGGEQRERLTRNLLKLMNAARTASPAGEVAPQARKAGN